jgi:hypothetical protein
MKFPEHRKARRNGPDPLGAVDGKVLSSLSRDEIYDSDDGADPQPAPGNEGRQPA